ncbi:MAG: 3-dehydroquinate dehydratase [Oscillospiraceae bacterium]|nr:3-dehydroquinate dehydratase [Oscillospiraceae bacterium]
MKLLVINGPCTNMLGIREPDIYGTESYESLCARIREYARMRGVETEIYQSNHEGALIDKILSAFGNADGIVLNPGAYAHTSVALLDAVRAVGIPTVEVHISDVSAREDFRRRSYVREACIAAIIGHGLDGYTEAMELLIMEKEE